VAGELQALDATGSTVYGQVVNEATAQFWNTSGTPAFENYATANIANYAITMTELGTASGVYKGNMPAVPAGIFTVVYRRRAGGVPAESDPVVHLQSVPWDGAAVVTLTSRATATALATVQADTDDIQSRLPAALTSGGNIKADSLAISGDTTAADNAESFFDGTGYAGTNNIIPHVTLVDTCTVNTDMRGTDGAALASAYTATRAGYLDTIKTKADQLVFTVPNQLDANVQYVNDVAVKGTGQSGNEWGPV